MRESSKTLGLELQLRDDAKSATAAKKMHVGQDEQDIDFLIDLTTLSSFAFSVR